MGKQASDGKKAPAPKPPPSPKASDGRPITLGESGGSTVIVRKDKN